MITLQCDRCGYKVEAGFILVLELETSFEKYYIVAEKEDAE